MKASERELALRAMREAQWAAAAAELLPRRVTKKDVTKSNAADVTKSKRGGKRVGAGRKRTGGEVVTAAERMREMRQRRKSGGG